MAEKKDVKEWTLMFYFASDNSLASAIVSQLKAIKAAGFHTEANVLAYFDPQPKNMPSHVFDVNLVEKLKRPGVRRFSFKGDDPFVKNLVFDRLWTEEDSDTKETLRQYFKKEKHFNYKSETVPATLTREQSPRDSLHEFLRFCRMRYPARHYMLFILGHGVVVGNDIFLLDENIPDIDDPVPTRNRRANPKPPKFVRKSVRNSLTLKALGEELTTFTREIGRQDGELELLGLHSCSMSGLEVAFELQGTANYMLASQGPAFVGSWPYKQMLTRVFNDLDNHVDDSKRNVKGRLRRFCAYCLQNSYDFQLAGYSFDIALCDLSMLKASKKTITVRLNELSSALIRGLEATDKSVQELIKGLILLAHWDAQSFWQEQYTDLYDFCFRLNRRCEDYANAVGSAKAEPAVDKIRAACQKVTELLKRDVDNGLIVRSGFIGPLFQYSHGLSVFFPWSEPVDNKFLERYAKYKFTTDLAKGDTWLAFLNTYFEKTKRDFHKNEKDPNDPVGAPLMENQILSVLQKVSSSISGSGGQLDRPIKGPGDPTGDSCECPTIKNYPSSTDPGPNVADHFEEQFEKAN